MTDPDLTGQPCREIASDGPPAPTGTPGPPEDSEAATDGLDDLSDLDGVAPADDQPGEDHPAGEPTPGG